MPMNRVVRVRPSDSVAAQTLRDELAALQDELEVTPGFPADVEEAAAAAVTSPRLPELDRTDIEFVTIDPASAMDLDQALHLERDGDGYLVHYAIADVGAFVEPGGPIDAEARRRGQTLYGADSKVPLHPKAISEDAGSLLADQVRPAIVWTMRVDRTGEGVDVAVERAKVRSRAKLSYDEAQTALDDGSASESLRLLAEVGRLRERREAERGGVSLPLPEQEIRIDGDHWSLEFRSLLPVEGWNAQISLMTGFAAATLMLRAKVGVLRTLPPADPRDVKRLRRTARALGIDWPADLDHPDFIRSLDPAKPAHAAMVVACTRLLRGSGYATFDGELPEQTEHAGLAAPYAHVTAPLRRLVDRFGLEICVALAAGEPVPGWVREGLADLDDIMRTTTQLANKYERAVLDLVEAAVLADRAGDTFAAVVVDLDDKDDRRGSITIAEPAIDADATGSAPLPLGEDVTVRLTKADPATRTVEFVVE